MSGFGGTDAGMGMPQMSMPPGANPLSNALGQQMGQSLDPNMFNGTLNPAQESALSPSFDMSKLADMLKTTGGKKSPYSDLGGPPAPTNQQLAYQMYLNQFNAQNKR